MTDVLHRVLRLFAAVFPGTKALIEGVWRPLCQATEEERRRWKL